MIVLNFWANLSLGVLIKFVLIKKRACIDEWIVDYENLNYVRLKIKTKKKPTCGYALQNYYRCIHNTRDWSPSKNPRRKLKLNPSARVKNTNCPFQMVVKIKQESCCTVDIECEHKQSVQSLEASHFRDVPPECVERVYLLFESGHTPSTARHQHLKDIRVSCKDGLNFRKKKADTSVVPQRRDFNYLYTRTQFCKETLGGGRGRGA